MLSKLILALASSLTLGSFVSLIHQTDTVPRLSEVPGGETVAQRIPAPSGYQRTKLADGSFGAFLRNSPLKPKGSKVLAYDGTPIDVQDKHVAVLDYDIGNRDLQQCADAVIRLRAEWLFSQKRYGEIQFHFTSGHLFKWLDYAAGKRTVVSGNKVSFVESAKADHSYASFRKYLDAVYMYAGTLSLSKELAFVKKQSDVKVGDVIIVGGSPGHVVILIDEAVNSKGDKVFLLAESYMPAQSIHILTNHSNAAIGPWYKVDAFGDNPTDRCYFSGRCVKAFPF